MQEAPTVCVFLLETRLDWFRLRAVRGPVVRDADSLITAHSTAGSPHAFETRGYKSSIDSSRRRQTHTLLATQLPHCAKDTMKKKSLAPYLAYAVAEEVQAIYSDQPQICKEPSDVAFAPGSLLEEWVEKTVCNHYLIKLAEAYKREEEGKEWRWPLQPFSVAISSDTSGDFAVAVVLDIQSSIKPLSKIIPTARGLIKRATDEYEGDDEGDDCWLCLEKKGDRFLDFFGCGHGVCEDCSEKVIELKRCGICRAPLPQNLSLRRDLVKKANDRRNGLYKKKNHKEVLEEVEALMRDLGLE
jgi:hypothetical protein